MKQADAYDLMIKEYLAKCKYYGCDGCIAEYWCIRNDERKLITDDKCVKKIKQYLRERK